VNVHELRPQRVRSRTGAIRTVRAITRGHAQFNLENHQRCHAAPFTGKNDPNCNACRELKQRVEEAL